MLTRPIGVVNVISTGLHGAEFGRPSADIGAPPGKARNKTVTTPVRLWRFNMPAWTPG